ncbi:HAMP domain-containing histidine kinase [Chitinophaga sp. Mgbs1]|uniref:histidine kinase n=1 Tax=Chitinophaga solisilvae TaxID=1233460 RepID=A0A9Q5CWS1_9BACT|nr:HAMP domain-containing histidine kinase [Chitinophaga solisilvae]
MRSRYLTSNYLFIRLLLLLVSLPYPATGSAALQGKADSTLHAQYLCRQAFYYSWKHADSSKQYALRARELSDRLSWAPGKAAAWYALGYYYELCHNNYVAFRYYLDALQLCEKKGLTATAGELYGHLAVYYSRQQQPAAAGHYLHKAMTTAARGLPDTLQAVILMDYATVQLHHSARPDSVKWALETARSLLSHSRDTPRLLQLSLLGIQLRLQQRDTAGALSRLPAFIHTAAGQGYNYPAIKGYQLMADIHPADAVSSYARMIRLAQAGSYTELIQPYAIRMYDWYTQHGHPDTAAQYSHLLFDILQKKEAAKSNGEMDYLGYYTQQHNLRQLQLQDALQQAVIGKQQQQSRNRVYLGIIIALLLLVTIFAGIYFFRARFRARKNAAQLCAMNREINEKNKLLLSQDDFKNKLVSVIAHDFRAPLGNIIEISTFLKQEVLTPEEAVEWMADIERKTHHTLSTFDNILAWVHSQISGFTWHPRPCRPAALLPDAIRYAGNMIAARQVQVQLQVPAQLAVSADPEMLQFIHRNLLHNAVRFSPIQGRLLITATQQAHTVTVSFSDEGPGIPQTLLPHLFTGMKSYRGKQQGAGLALIICHDFIEKMGGSLHAANKPDGGAIFSYTLPLNHNPS